MELSTKEISMKSLKHKDNIFSIESILAIYAVFCAGGGSDVQNMLYGINNASIIGTMIIILFCLFIIVKHLKEINLKDIVLLVGFLLIWGWVGTIMTRGNNHYFYIIYNIFTSYAIFLGYKKRIFLKFENVVTFFAALSLVLFFACWFIPPAYNMLHSFSWGRHGDVDLSFFRIFLMSNSSIYLFPFRNAGFAWEPGRYSVILVVALFFNMCRYHFNNLRNPNFYILTLALITTQSTTGYVCYAVLIIYFFLKSRKKVIALTLISVLGAAFITYGFLSEKMITLFNWQDDQASNFTEYVYWRAEKNEAYVPQRFEGLTYDFLNVVHSPIFGYGPEVSNSYMNTEVFPGARVAPSNGIIQILASAGLLVGLFFYLLLFRASRSFSYIFKINEPWWFFILFLLINVSYNFWFITIFLVFVMYNFYEKTLRNYSHI